MSLIDRFLQPTPRRMEATVALVSKLPGFDPIYYRYWYRDIQEGVDPLEHYLTIGWREGRDPSDGFSTRGYLKTHPDVVDADMNPLIHFVNFGIVEGRTGWHKQPGQAAPKPVVSSTSGLKLLGPPSHSA